MHGALVRYRTIAWIVGTGLLVLVLVGMPLKYAGGNETVVAIVGPVHGFLFMIYLALTFDLSRRLHWSFPRMILVMAAGTIPFLSFWTERKVSRDWARTENDEAALAKSPV